MPASDAPNEIPDQPQSRDKPSKMDSSNTTKGSASLPAIQPVTTTHATLARYSTKFSNSSINSFCGAAGGMASGIVTCPLDVIKTRLQAQGSFRRAMRQKQPGSALYQGMIGTARTIWREDGVRGMYRGLGPMLLGYLPTWAVYMAVYDSSREYYYTQMDNKWGARVLASITAGATSTFATNPIWVIKTRLMSQVSSNAPEDARTPWHYRSTFHAAKTMWQKEGFRVFYSGLAPALLGLSHVAIQFPLYEYFKLQFTGLSMGENTTASDNDTHFLGILAATFLSKVCATSATYPHEVLRTRLQTQQHHVPSSIDEISFRGGHGHADFGKRTLIGASSDGMLNLPRYSGMIRTIKTIIAEEGWRAFYSGMGTNMVRAVPAAMTTMVTFETLKTWIHRLQVEGKQLLEEDGHQAG